jgi:hypothetical protein
MARRTKAREEVKPTAEREEVSRRQFLRQTAEVAAWSLFGTMGLDAITKAVVNRIAERQGIERLAGRGRHRSPARVGPDDDLPDRSGVLYWDGRRRPLPAHPDTPTQPS